jgi:plasminogen activator inhibitor 1 RNA-binding protein
MASYAVGTTNLFDLLGDDADKPARKQKAQPKKKEEPKKSAPRKEDNRGNQKRDNVNRRRNNNNRGGAGGRGSGAPRRNKREYDRRSGTGRGRETKKDGHGKFNWGTDGDFDGHPNDRQPRRDRRPRKDDSQAKPADADETAQKVADDATPAEPEPLSYDEYLESLKSKAVDGDELKLRAANNDDSQFEACGVLKNETDDLASVFDIKISKDRKKNKGKKKNKKKAVSLDEFVAAKPQRRNNRDRNNRDRNNRPNNRNNRNQRSFNMKDQDFPTLG